MFNRGWIGRLLIKNTEPLCWDRLQPPQYQIPHCAGAYFYLCGELNVKIVNMKNAIIFKVTLPAAELLTDHLNEFLFSDITELEMRKAGFIPNPITAELVTPFEGGLSFSLRLDEKIVPAHVIKKEVDERVATVEARELRKLDRKEKRDIKYSVCMDLCKVAFVKTTIITSYYNTEHKILIVATGSASHSQLVTRSLIKVVGSVKTETIHIDDIKNGLTTRLQSYINDIGQPFEGFTVGDYIQLSRRAEQLEVIKYDTDIYSISEELRGHLNTCFVVDQMDLEYKGVTFRLNDKFHIKQIAFDYVSQSDDDDKAFAWRHEAAVATLQLTSIINQLCALLGYKPKETKE